MSQVRGPATAGPLRFRRVLASCVAAVLLVGAGTSAFVGTASGAAFTARTAGWDPLTSPSQFATPPSDAKPKIRWWWAAPLDVNETIKEMQYMKDAGFGGAEI